MKDLIDRYKSMGAPADQMALVSLLKQLQQHSGGVPSYLLPELAKELEVKESFLLAVIRRIPSLRLADTHCLQLCAGPNCGKATALAAFAEDFCKGKCEVQYVPCMRMCGKGPNVKYDGKLYHRADQSLVRRLVEGEKET